MPCDDTNDQGVDDQSAPIADQRPALMGLVYNQRDSIEGMRNDLAALEQRISDVVLSRARRLALHPGDTIL
jgi:hypothetical protein